MNPPALGSALGQTAAAGRENSSIVLESSNAGLVATLHMMETYRCDKRREARCCHGTFTRPEVADVLMRRLEAGR